MWQEPGFEYQTRKFTIAFDTIQIISNYDNKLADFLKNDRVQQFHTFHMGLVRGEDTAGTGKDGDDVFAGWDKRESAWQKTDRITTFPSQELQQQYNYIQLQLQHPGELWI